MNEIHNIELEQNILGCILLNNKSYYVTADLINEDHFYDPVHKDIFAAAAKRLKADLLVSPVTMTEVMRGHDGLKELADGKYLARLAGAAISLFAIRDHAKMLVDIFQKRELQKVLRDASEALDSGDVSASEVVGSIEAGFLANDATDGSGPMSMLEAVKIAAEKAGEAHQSEGVVGVTSGLIDLDRMTGGLQGGELVLLGGRPSMGKTAVALSMALDAARSGKGVVISSLEMTPDSLALRAISNETAKIGKGVAYTDAKRGDMTEDNARTFFESTTATGALPIEILPSNMRDMGAIYAGVKKSQRILAAKGTPLALIVIDYLQLISSSAKSRFEIITEISIAMKALAMRMNVPVLALSQLSRSLESRDINNRRPMLSDLRESGQLEQDADMVLFCYRHEYYLERETPPEDEDEAFIAHGDALAKSRNKMEIIVAKQRMGEIGTVHVGFNPATNFLWDQERRGQIIGGDENE